MPVLLVPWCRAGAAGAAVLVAGAGAGRVRRGSAGLYLGVLSAAAFGTSGAFASSLIGAGWSPAAAVLARISMAALMLTIPALIQLRGRWSLLRRAAPRVARLRPGGRRRLPAVLLQRGGPDAGRRGPAARVPGHRAGGGLAVAAPRPAAEAAHRGGCGRVDRRADPGPQPDRGGRDQPGRGDVGAARSRVPGDLLPAVGRHRRRAASPDRHGLGRDVRGRAGCWPCSARSGCCR